jgi:NOL1/NOP2/sun family putative RNA methylase
VPLSEQFIERLKLLLPDHFDRVMKAFSHPRVTSFRVNTLKATTEEITKDLEAAGYSLHQVSWWKDAFYLPNVEVQQIFHPAYVEGKMYVQGLSSMLPPLILDPQPEERILDLTAAPGSKTTQMAALMNNEGSILANDLSPVRLFKLQANLKQQGVINTQVKRGLGELLWRKFPEQFDRVLVDVPCSMEGRIFLDDPKTYEEWSLKKIKELSMRQRQLLRSAISATKPGGTIVYSTCTLAPEENEEVVQWVLEKENGKVVLEPVQIEGLSKGPSELVVPGITQWQNQTFSDEMSKTLRIYPSQTMEGFFVAKLRKLESTITPESWERSPKHFSRGRGRRR